MKPRVVQKYGGTSIGTAERMRAVVDIVKNSREAADVVVAISAMSPRVKAEGTTSLLLAAIDAAMNAGDVKSPLERIKAHHYEAIEAVTESAAVAQPARDYFDEKLGGLEHFLQALGIIQELSPRSKDAVLCVGEQLSARLLSAALEDAGVPSEFVDLAGVCPGGMSTPDRTFWDAVQDQIGRRVEPTVEAERVPVLTGFIGPVPGGIIDAVGRGYTDYTAALAAAALDAEELQIWKEVDGVYTTDPRKVPEARVLASLTPREAAELTYFGSEVVHPMTMERAIRAGVPLRIKNTFNPAVPGTVITDSDDGSAAPVKCITAKRGVTVLNIESNRMLMAYGFMAKLFGVFAAFNVVIDLISTSEVNVSLTVEKDDNLPDLIKALSELGEVTTEREMAIVSVVGQRMKHSVGLAARMFRCLAEANVNIEMISQGASEINISCVISGSDAERAIKALHAEFIESAG